MDYISIQMLRKTLTFKRVKTRISGE